MPDYVVKTTFTAKDHVSDTYDAMGRSADRFGDKAASSFRRAGKEGHGFGSIVKGLVAHDLIQGVGNGLRKVGMDFLRFGDTTAAAAARFDDIGPGAKNVTQRIDGLGKVIRASIKGTRFSAVEAADAIDELSKAGYTSTSGLLALPNLMAFATAAGESLAESTAMSSDILGAFGLRSKDVQVQLKNHATLNDELTKSSLLATGGLKDLFETLKDTAPLSKDVRLTRQELLAMSIVLSNAGIKGGEAATSIKRGLVNIFAGDGTKILKARGIAIADNTGKLRKYTSVLSDLKASLAPLSDKQRFPILRQIFGLHGFAGNLKMMQDLDQMLEYEQQLMNATGTSKAVAKMRDESTWAKSLMVINALIEKGFQIFDKFEGSGKKGLDVFLEKVEAFDVGPVVESLKAVAATAKILWKILEPFVPYLPQIVATFIAWKGVLFAIGTGKAIFNIIKFVGTNWVAMGDGVSVAAAAFDVFGISLGAVAATAAAAVVALVSLKAAYDSYTTGKDNFISKMAQDAGLVPKTITNENGVVIGTDTKNFKPDYGNMAAVALGPTGAPLVLAISRLISELRQNSKQTIDINLNNAPAGSTATSNSAGGAPVLMKHMLGANL